MTEKNKAINKETASIIVDKLLQDYDLVSEDIGECVELYYDAQKLRILHENKGRSEGDSPMKVWYNRWLFIGEKVLVSKLKHWIESEDAPAESRWAYAQVGIGPVIAAGLAAYVDVSRSPTVSALWKFSGQAPGFDRKVKGQKLVYNSRLKVLIWKLGESFVKVSGKEGATYGRLYAEFKAEEVQRNEEGRYKEAAAKALANKKWRDDTATLKRLKQGKLSDAHLHARAKRRAVKVFLAHYWLRGREAAGLPITEPYVFGPGGHSLEHQIPAA